MKKAVCIALALVMLITLCACNKTREKQKFTAYYFDWFDTASVITGYEYSKEDFDAVCLEVKALLDEYHLLYDIYTRYEGVNNLLTVNKSAGEAVTVDEKIIDLLEYAKQMYYVTSGNVNVAMGSVLSIWHDCRTAGLSDPANARLPDMDRLIAAAEHTDIEDVIIDRENMTVCLADPDMKLDVGAIAKGYATEQAAKYLEEKGISGYVLNIGGNVRSVGVKPDGEPWAAGIENPDTFNAETPYIAYLHLSGESLVTSGSYQRYYTVDGVDYHHIIDPDTLMPGNRYLSVSVLCLDSGQGDAFSTALFNMDIDDGLALVEATDDLEAMWVQPDGEIVYSSGFGEYTFEYNG